MTTKTIAAKIIEGLHSQGWKVLGHGGTWAGAVRTLEEYIDKRVERAVKAEREACAKAAEWVPCMTDTPQRCAAAIRARSKE